MPELTADDARKLARSFYDLATKLGKFRFDNWTRMSNAERSELESLEWTLLTQSSDLTTRAISLTTDDLQQSLQDISRAARKMTRAVERVADAKRVIRIANKALRLGAAIFTGNAQAITSALSAAISAADTGDDEL
ncbi:MAG TPA: hypothetical protein VGJ64_06300 [Gemmatimonadaceae bacterium]|jgi:hypothetical protein